MPHCLYLKVHNQNCLCYLHLYFPFCLSQSFYNFEVFHWPANLADPPVLCERELGARGGACDVVQTARALHGSIPVAHSTWMIRQVRSVVSQSPWTWITDQANGNTLIGFKMFKRDETLWICQCHSVSVCVFRTSERKLREVIAQYTVTRNCFD